MVAINKLDRFGRRERPGEPEDANRPPVLHVDADNGAATPVSLAERLQRIIDERYDDAGERGVPPRTRWDGLELIADLAILILLELVLAAFVLALIFLAVSIVHF